MQEGTPRQEMSSGRPRQQRAELAPSHVEAINVLEPQVFPLSLQEIVIELQPLSEVRSALATSASLIAELPAVDLGPDLQESAEIVREYIGFVSDPHVIQLSEANCQTELT
jgi:hypothetical protein